MRRKIVFVAVLLAVGCAGERARVARVSDRDRGSPAIAARNIGEPIQVIGTVTAASHGDSGKVDSVVIQSGEYAFQVADPQLRERLALELGRRVELTGFVGTVGPGQVTVNVTDFSVVGN